MTVLTPKEILTQAADLIEKKGLTKGSYVNDDCELCVEGALRQAMFGDPCKLGIGTEELIPIEVRLAKHLRPRADVTGSFAPFFIITEWNDDPATTKEDVVAALRAAAEDGQ